ncbi:MAG: hypothetical protein SGBAC_007478 [Bacillariaceae sp.]
MDDQLELHLQRCLEDENENDTDSDLLQLLALQSSTGAASEENAKATAAAKQVGESPSLVDEEDVKRPQQKEIDTQPQSPIKPLESKLDYHTTPATNTTEDPPITIGTDRFFRIVHLLESQFESPKSFMEVMIKLFWVLPVGMVLEHHFGWVWSLQWAVIGIMVLNIKPDHLMANEAKNYDGNSNKATVDISRHAKSNASVEPDNQLLQRQKEEKELIKSTKVKISHLLGLAGAPPPLWPLGLDHQSASRDDKSEANNTATDLSTVLPSLVYFVKSHVQFLLTIDQALDYLRTSASIHLGLGPQSQCVERVEQAAIAREFRQHRKKKSQAKDALNPIEDDKSKAKATKNRGLEPQRGPAKSVLSLVALRRNLAKSMVHQSAMFDAFWEHVYEHQGSDMGNEDGFQQYSRGREPLLEIPHVVSLAWIKSTRHVLAESLSGTVEETFLLLQPSPSEDKGLSDTSRIWCWLEDADARTQQLTQYLRGILLLPNDCIAEAAESPTAARSIENPNDPLFRTLLSFRTQLDALGTALWSCQQYCNQSSGQNGSTDDVLNDDPSLLENSKLSKREWWLKIQRMSETCQAFETEITQAYFPPEVDLDESDADSNGTNADAHHLTSQENGDYVHDESKRQYVEGDAKKDMPIKTLVFSGKGKVEDRPKKSGRKGERKTGSGSGGVDFGLGLPQRDTVSEMAMISELQNRIKAVIQDEEIEEVILDHEEEKAAKLSREPTAPFFLGASGSLLAELKQSIPSMGVLGAKTDKDDLNEEIIGED